ncbi:MAG: hypothetical protein ACHQ2Y_09590 [Candidatus Lutacidiplasmatales archaeon]
MAVLPVPTTPEAEVPLRSLSASVSPVSIIARVVRAELREVTRRSDGGRRPVLTGLLSDGSATVRFTWWDPPKAGVDVGMVLRASPAEVREFRGRVELNFSFRTRVEEASEVELPKLRPEEIPLTRLDALTDGSEGLWVEARVAATGSKSVTVGSERRVVFEGRLADSSGSVGFTAWVDFGLKAGEAIRVTGGYVRSFRGRPQLTLDERSSIERIDGVGLPSAESVREPTRRTVSDLELASGADHTRVEGTVVGLLPPSGLVERCPNCRRTLTGGSCRLHGHVPPVADLRARMVLDDGTGALTVNCGRADTERLWGVSLSTCLERASDRSYAPELEEELARAILGRRLRVDGRAVKDDFGVTVFPDSITTVSPDIRSSAAGLRRRVRRGAA